MARDHEELRAIQKEVKRKLKEAKNKYSTGRGLRPKWDRTCRKQRARLQSTGGPRICCVERTEE